MGNIVGRLDILSVYSNELKEERTIRVLTPPELLLKRPYSVIYMHDGQNLFDADTAFAGEWEVDEALYSLYKKHRRGVVVVGVDNTPNRLNELCPRLGDSGGEGELGKAITDPCGELYAKFIVNTLMPLIAGRYPVASDRAHTLVGGSSMGGLMSIFMAARYPEIFSGAICFSPALLALSEQGRQELFELAKNNIDDASLYFYVGGEGFEGEFVKDARRFAKGLLDGAHNARITYVEKPQNAHCEAAWREELPAALEFLLK